MTCVSATFLAMNIQYMNNYFKYSIAMFIVIINTDVLSADKSGA